MKLTVTTLGKFINNFYKNKINKKIVLMNLPLMIMI